MRRFILLCIAFLAILLFLCLSITDFLRWDNSKGTVDYMGFYIGIFFGLLGDITVGILLVKEIIKKHKS